MVNAVDNDAAGEAQAERIKEIVPHAKRLKPNGLDWNSDLRALLNLSRSESIQPQSQQATSSQTARKKSRGMS